MRCHCSGTDERPWTAPSSAPQMAALVSVSPPLRTVANVKVQQVHMSLHSKIENEVEQWRAISRRNAARDLE